MKNCYNLFLDDVRTPHDVFEYTNQKEYKNLQWEIARSYDDFVNIFSHRYIHGQMPCLISFDHDLAAEHYLLGASTLYHSFDEEKVTIPTGWHTLVWLLNFYDSNDLKLPNILIHTKNPGGAVNMYNSIREFRDKRNLNFN